MTINKKAPGRGRVKPICPAQYMNEYMRIKNAMRKKRNGKMIMSYKCRLRKVAAKSDAGGQPRKVWNIDKPKPKLNEMFY